METTLVALYDDPCDARRACGRLDGKGVDRAHISLVANDAGGAFSRVAGIETAPGRRLSTATPETDVGMVTELEEPWLGRDAELVDLGGVGPTRVAGPIALLLEGKTQGPAGDLVACLAAFGVPRPDAEGFAEGVRRGGSLIVVRTVPARADDIADTLESFRPVDLDERVRQWRAEGWSGFDPAAPPWTGVASDRAGEPMSRDRDFGY
jgi:hypothetical protein